MAIPSSGNIEGLFGCMGLICLTSFWLNLCGVVHDEGVEVACCTFNLIAVRCQDRHALESF